VISMAHNRAVFNADSRIKAMPQSPNTKEKSSASSAPKNKKKPVIRTLGNGAGSRTADSRQISNHNVDNNQKGDEGFLRSGYHEDRALQVRSLLQGTNEPSMFTREAALTTEEDALRRRAAQLQQDVQLLNQKKLRAFMMASEDQLRSQAQQQLEDFTKELKDALDKRLRSLFEDKEQRVAECDSLQLELKQKIIALQKLHNDLDRRIVELDKSYEHCVQELQHEYDISLAREKAQLEERIRRKLQGILTQHEQDQAKVISAALSANVPDAGEIRLWSSNVTTSSSSSTNMQ